MLYDQLPESEDSVVSLRRICQSDLSAWANYLRMPEVFEHTSWNVHYPAELLHYTNKEECASSLLRLAIILRESGQLVGTIGFHTVQPQNRSAELAYDLSPQVWGQGIASRMCLFFTEWGHRSADLVRVQASVLVSNERSIRVLGRCGFEREGLLRSYRMVRGHPGNFYMYAHVSPPAPVT